MKTNPIKNLAGKIKTDFANGDKKQHKSVNKLFSQKNKQNRTRVYYCYQQSLGGCFIAENKKCAEQWKKADKRNFYHEMTLAYKLSDININNDWDFT